MAHRSKKRAKLYKDERVPFVAAKLRLHPWCQAGDLIKTLVLDYNNCAGKAVDVHEPLTRARGGSITDWDNALSVCRPCHTWCDENQQLAHQVGLLRHSWERPSQEVDTDE